MKDVITEPVFSEKFMEILKAGILPETVFMKKILSTLTLLFFLGIITSNAQSEKLKPPPPPPPAPPKIELTKFVPPAKELKEFYKQNPDVEKLYWKSGQHIVVVHKDKKEFTYDMKNKQQKDAFKEKYGDEIIKTPLPPPPPPLKPKAI